MCRKCLQMNFLICVDKKSLQISCSAFPLVDQFVTDVGIQIFLDDALKFVFLKTRASFPPNRMTDCIITNNRSLF